MLESGETICRCDEVLISGEWVQTQDQGKLLINEYEGLYRRRIKSDDNTSDTLKSTPSHGLHGYSREA